MNKSNFKRNTNYLEQLYNMLTDIDALVVVNAIEAINEILADKGGIDITRQLVINLLNRIKDFNEWGQSVILDLCAKYQPLLGTAWRREAWEQFGAAGTHTS